MRSEWPFRTLRAEARVQVREGAMIIRRLRQMMPKERDIARTPSHACDLKGSNTLAILGDFTPKANCKGDAKIRESLLSLGSLLFLTMRRAAHSGVNRGGRAGGAQTERESETRRRLFFYIFYYSELAFSIFVPRSMRQRGANTGAQKTHHRSLPEFLSLSVLHLRVIKI